MPKLTDVPVDRAYPGGGMLSVAGAERRRQQRHSLQPGASQETGEVPGGTR